MSQSMLISQPDLKSPALLITLMAWAHSTSDLLGSLGSLDKTTEVERNRECGLPSYALQWSNARFSYSHAESDVHNNGPCGRGT